MVAIYGFNKERNSQYVLQLLTPNILSQDLLVNTPHMKMPMLYTLVLFCFLVKWATE